MLSFDNNSHVETLPVCDLQCSSFDLLKWAFSGVLLLIILSLLTKNIIINKGFSREGKNLIYLF